MPTKTTNRQNAFCDRNMLAIVIEVQNRRTGFRPRRAPHQIEAGALYAVLASAGDGKGEDRYYPLISAPRTQARLGRCSSAGPRPAAAGAAIRPCARARDRTLAGR